MPIWRLQGGLRTHAENTSATRRGCAWLVAAFRSPTLILKKKRRCGGRPAACNPGSWAVSASTQAARSLGWPLHLQSPFGFGHRDQGRIELHERFVDGAVLGMARLAA